MRPVRPLVSILVLTTWSGVALAQGAPPPAAPPPAAPPGAAMTVPGAAAPATQPAAPATTSAPAPGAFVLRAAPPAAPAAGPAPATLPPAPTVAHYDPYVRRPLVLEGHTSFGGPSGWIGIGLDYSLSRYFSIMGGAGLGQSGPQVSTMARLRVPMDTVSAGFGAGFSAGEYEDGLLATDDRFRWDTAYWFNTEGFIEIRSRRGINIRPYIGSGAILNRTDGKVASGDTQCLATPGKPAVCADVSPSRDRSPFLFYMGAAIGYAFEL